jgi:hypothetical protein
MVARSHPVGMGTAILQIKHPIDVLEVNHSYITRYFTVNGRTRSAQVE